PAPIGIFPNAKEKARLDDYEYYRRLFLGKHFEAFRIKIDDEKYNRAYAKLRYLVVNFAGLLSKIMADMLFSEPPTITLPDGDQGWVDAFWRENKMDVQCYESALGNSYNGDAVFKMRAGKRNTADDDSTVIVEDMTPRIYFPEIDGFNVRAEPDKTELKWTFQIKDQLYLRKEIHTSGKIENKIYEMKGDKIMSEVGFGMVGLELEAEQMTNINEPLIVHVPNWKTGDRFFGLSDYHDLTTLFYALNNRITKVDNILDKHGDPILMVPPGVLDEKGNVKKKALGVIEVEPGENGKPEYIVWDASLDAAFKEVEKLVDFLYLTAEISPDLLGMGEGVSDSGRALKFKLMRTLAKTARKRLYYDQAIKQLVYNAQVFAKANNLKVGGKALTKDPVKPEIDWKDGLPIDNTELQADIIQAIDAGIESKKGAIMKLDDVDEQSAKDKLAEIEKEQPKVELPAMKLGEGEKLVDPKTGKPPVIPPTK
ncbi:MAG: phage portal protein, partial [Candidatus Paceibacterota bacterium]